MNRYDEGYEFGVAYWVEHVRDLTPKERQFKGMAALVHCVKEFVEREDWDSARDYAAGFAQALVDKEEALNRAMGKVATSFCVSNYAFVLSNMAKSFSRVGL